MRTIPGISHLLKPLHDTIDTIIKVSFQGYNFNPTERVLLSLSANCKGMGLIIPSEICEEEYKNYRAKTKETTNKVMRNGIQFQDNHVSTTKIESDIKNRKKKAERCKTARSNQ